jgi:hypothetical protein
VAAAIHPFFWIWTELRAGASSPETGCSIFARMPTLRRSCLRARTFARPAASWQCRTAVPRCVIADRPGLGAARRVSRSWRRPSSFYRAAGRQTLSTSASLPVVVVTVWTWSLSACTPIHAFMLQNHCSPSLAWSMSGPRLHHGTSSTWATMDLASMMLPRMSSTPLRGRCALIRTGFSSMCRKFRVVASSGIGSPKFRTAKLRSGAISQCLFDRRVAQPGPYVASLQAGKLAAAAGHQFVRLDHLERRLPRLNLFHIRKKDLPTRLLPLAGALRVRRS